MAYNLFIAYDLVQPGQHYEAVRAAIKSLGTWYQFQQSLFYVHTQHAPADAYTIILRSMDANDRLAVIDAQAGVVTDWDKPPIAAINEIWHSR